MKKSIFKRWWFWAIIAVIIIAIAVGGGNDKDLATEPEDIGDQDIAEAPIDNTNQTEPSKKPALDNDIWTKAGMYKVGTDIPAGEYFLLSTSAISAYYQVSKDSSGTLDSIIANDNFEGSRYLTLAEGQYFELRNAKFTTVDKAPVQEAKNGAYEPGMYKVGRDIEAGEYKVIPLSGMPGYYEVAKDSSGTLNSIITNDNIDTEKYITIGENQYIKLYNCQLKK